MRMTTALYLKSYCVSLAAFLTLDLLWLGVVARGFYAHQLGALMRADVKWPAALAFYLFFLIGLMVFVVRPAVEASSVGSAAGFGALFGFITYQTYELTNYALVEGWPIAVVAVDILWGVFLSSAVSLFTTWVVVRWLA